ncbi:hypothetical protein HU200_024263 [Digitaria exilis]|uniref:PWWP domain-containing protein n=1 Tax=Digitaria exilis TaxID=1010633 RepID=A0A835C484_9POAL|nr:hypothetical protein HU200_024263 [Digitaria exilis]CAB3461240.1 unnamed protein product [Digitaria exilis]
MSSGAVAASDPGGGEPKLVASADVEMTEADGVVPAPAAEAKAEGKAAVAADVGPEEGDVAAPALSDPLYATESAGMVGVEGPGDELVKGVEGLNGGDEGRLEAGAGGLQNEAEMKPVPVEDSTAAAGQEVEAAASSEYAEAESNKLEENDINAERGTDNSEADYGVAHSDKEIQNNVSGEVEGTSKIYEDERAPVVDQPDDGSLTLPQTGEQFPDVGNGPSSNEVAAGLGNIVQGARYCLPPLDKGSFQVADLVWGKVKSHPWWPGEIFDPSDASELALKHQKKGSHLVAYFGDSTFAWCDESQLKPFVTNYSQMEKQSSSDAFVGSVNNALEELSRRILSGMSCSCLPEELADNGMSYTVDNAGLKDGVTCSAVNRSEIINSFSPENLLHYIKDLALFPGQGGDLLELVIACSQLTSFYRSKGCPELASFQSGDGWVEDGLDGTDTPATQNVMVEEVVINEVQPTQPTPDKPKRGRGRPRKQKPGDGQVVMEKKDLSNRANVTSHDEKQMVMDFDDFDNLQNKKKRNFDSFEDSEKASTLTGGSSFKIGECIRRAASQLTGSSSIVKAQNEPTSYKNAAEAENGEFDISSDDAVDEFTVEKRAKRRRLHRNHTADPKELLSQLCLVATEPMNGYSFSAMIISYFNDYRNYIVSTTTEANIVEKGTSRRGRKRKEVVLPSPEVETTDHMQDSYWSGLSLHNHPIHDLRKESPNTRPRRRRRSSRHAYVPLSELGDSVPKKQIQVIERSIIHVDEKMVDELKPTALVLSFGRSASIPSELDLVKMFSRYGPLKETETEVDRDTNTVKVVFKKRADAERAFSAAGKYGTFGPSLRSFRLVNMPFYLKTLSANNPVKHSEDHGVEIPDSCNCEAPKDAMEVDLVQKTEKVEVAVELSVEQVETVKQVSQVETANTAFTSLVDTVEKTGKGDAELIVHVNQIGTTAQAVTGASLGGTIDEIQLGDAPNQALLADTTNTFQVEAAPEAQTSQSDGRIEESTQDVSDSMEMNVTAEAPKHTHISGDITVSEAITETPGTAQASSEVDIANELKVAVEVESKATVELSGEQVYNIEQTVQVEAVTEASAGKLDVGRQTPEDESKTEAINEHSTVMIEETVEPKAAPDEENIENNAAAINVADVTAAGETKEEAPDEKGKTENKAAADTLAGETRGGETTPEAPDEKAENKATAEPVTGETAEATAEPVEEAKTSEEMVEDVKALDDKTMPVEKPVEDAMVVTQDERTNTVEKTVEDAKVEEPDDKTTTAEVTMEDAMPDRKNSEAETTVEGATLEAPEGKDAAAEKILEDTTVKAQDVQAGASE